VSLPAPATTQLCTLSLHDALPIFLRRADRVPDADVAEPGHLRDAAGQSGSLHGRSAAREHSDRGHLAFERPDPALRFAAVDRDEIGRATSELQSRENLVCRLLLEK